VENMLYMTSTAVANGQSSISIAFTAGTDLDTAQVQVQNRVSVAEPRLPEQVRQLGVVVSKQAPGFLMLLTLTASDPSVSLDYMGNWANTTVRDRLLRIDGVGDVRVFGGGDYSMRIWIDPDRAAARDLTATEIVAALRRQNVQVAAGAIGQAPFDEQREASFLLPIQMEGRLDDPAEFEDVVVKVGADGAITRLRDVGRAELTRQDFTVSAFSGEFPTVGIAVIPQPGSNELATAEAVL